MIFMQHGRTPWSFLSSVVLEKFTLSRFSFSNSGVFMMLSSILGFVHVVGCSASYLFSGLSAVRSDSGALYKRTEVGSVFARLLIWICAIALIVMVTNILRVFVAIGTRSERMAGRQSVVLNADRWAVLSNTGFSWGRVDDVVSGKTVASYGDGDPNFRMILKAMGADDLHVVMMTQTNVQFVVAYQAGMDPTHIPVSLKEGRILFQVGDCWYRGGSARRFLDLISSSATIIHQTGEGGRGNSENMK